MRLNCDLGESFGNWQLLDERDVMPFIHMANIACGYHAGDPITIVQTLRLARQFGVAVGAHPSYPDLMGFGRRSMACTPTEIQAMLLYQVGALRELAMAEDLALNYVKPHGALYNDMMGDETVLHAVLAALQRCRLPLMMMATPRNDHYRRLAEDYGVGLIFEAFADRRYTADGRLQPRAQTGAVLHSAEEILAQVHALCAGSVTASDGRRINIEADSLCVHGDNADAVAMIRQVHAQLE
ncbi:5-oxoprolinase subunit PxpA [Microbulbifer pacificus]|uniref:5-oxoprolinase subunit PxpA n=1 Tax=Microbulbifer pacificus TaxID=407164 RepID=A0AAU0MX85_9GAMM|nr:5-oxoprolinase subunit PxpA [Microbulbifer pacificus]WOX04728.1 5-oxoprolinase subunit PxpA [Microbulbifer pacificus]